MGQLRIEQAGSAGRLQIKQGSISDEQGQILQHISPLAAGAFSGGLLAVGSVVEQAGTRTQGIGNFMRRAQQQIEERYLNQIQNPENLRRMFDEGIRSYP